MHLSRNNLTETELKNDIKDWFKNFLNHKENWHNGKTSKENYLNGVKSKKYAQYKTTIINDNQEKDYVIYDEIILINNEPFLILKIYNDKKEETLTSIIYLEENEIVQQIRHLTYQQFFKEVNDNEPLIKTKESENTTIIKTPILDFIKNIDKYQTDEQQPILKQENLKKRKNKKYVWWIIKFIAFTGCIVISTTLGLIPSAIILGIAAIKPLAIGVSIGLGFIAIPWNNIRNKIVDWVFKGKHKEEIENKEKEIKDLKPECKESNELIKKLFLNPNLETKQKLILFYQIWEKNKNIDVYTLQKELNKKFYAKQIENWNKNWNKKVEFTKFLKPENIREIKEIFNESKKNNLIMPDGFFYQPKKTWTRFKKEKTSKNTLQKEENFDKIKSDIDIIEKYLSDKTMNKFKKEKTKKTILQKKGNFNKIKLKNKKPKIKTMQKMAL